MGWGGGREEGEGGRLFIKNRTYYLQMCEVLAKMLSSKERNETVNFNLLVILFQFVVVLGPFCLIVKKKKREKKRRGWGGEFKNK